LMLKSVVIFIDLVRPGIIFSRRKGNNSCQEVVKRNNFRNKLGMR
jgi:hypothetical protein